MKTRWIIAIVASATAIVLVVSLLMRPRSAPAEAAVKVSSQASDGAKTGRTAVTRRSAAAPISPVSSAQPRPIQWEKVSTDVQLDDIHEGLGAAYKNAVAAARAKGFSAELMRCASKLPPLPSDASAVDWEALKTEIYSAHDAPEFQSFFDCVRQMKTPVVVKLPDRDADGFQVRMPMRISGQPFSPDMLQEDIKNLRDKLAHPRSPLGEGETAFIEARIRWDECVLKEGKSYEQCASGN